MRQVIAITSSCVVILAAWHLSAFAQVRVLDYMEVLDAPPICKACYRQGEKARQQGNLNLYEQCLLGSLREVQKSNSLVCKNKDLLLQKLMTDMMRLSWTYEKKNQYDRCEYIIKNIVSAEEMRSGSQSSAMIGWLFPLQDIYKKEGKNKEAADVNLRIEKIQASATKNKTNTR